MLEIPTDHLPRFIPLPPGENKRKKELIILDNIIRFCLDDIFACFFDYDEIAAYSFKMTRDAEFDLSSQLDLSLLEKMSSGLKQRLTAMPVRLAYDMEMPRAMVRFLTSKLRMSSFDSIMPGGRYHNFKDFIGFPNVRITSYNVCYTKLLRVDGFGEGIGALEHHAYPTPQGSHIHTLIIDVLAMQADLALDVTDVHQVIHTVDATQQCGLATTGGTDKRGYLPLGDLHADVVESLVITSYSIHYTKLYDSSTRTF